MQTSLLESLCGFLLNCDNEAAARAGAGGVRGRGAVRAAPMRAAPAAPATARALSAANPLQLT